MDLAEKIASVAPPMPPGIKQQLLRAYSELGKSLGYSPALGEKGVCLIWGKTNEDVAFEIQFGNRQEFGGSIRRLFDCGAKMCVFVTSSAAHTASLQEIARFVDGNFSWGQRMFLIYDLETGKRILLGENAPAYAGNDKKIRKKKIFGKKGEHKVQD